MQAAQLSGSCWSANLLLLSINSCFLTLNCKPAARSLTRATSILWKYHALLKKTPITQMASEIPGSRSMCCVHVSARCIERAASAVKHAAASHFSHDMICIECKLSGLSTDPKFRQHFLSDQHFVLARIKHPFELYCCHCADYQYSDFYDQLIGRKRAGRANSTFDSLRSKKLMFDRPKPRAIVNMGSTCFMGSVLQVMINNSVILLSKQMQVSKTGLEPCSKKNKSSEAKTSASNSNGANGTALTDISDVGAILDLEDDSAHSCLTSGCIACEFKSLLSVPMSSSPRNCTDDKGKLAVQNAIIPSNLLYAVWSHADYVAGYDQQDAHEFLIALLDGLGSHLEKHHGETNTSFPRFPSPLEPSNNYPRGVTDLQQLSPTLKAPIFAGLTALNDHISSRSLIVPDSPCAQPHLLSPRQSPWSPRSGLRNSNRGFRGFVNEVNRNFKNS